MAPRGAVPEGHFWGARMSLRDLKVLESLRMEFGPGLEERKLTLLARLSSGRLRSPGAVARLHEALCFMRAYPDSPVVLANVVKLLEGFERRPDLRASRPQLASSGIAGTATHYRFYQPTATWLARRWPERLHLDWPEMGDHERFERLLGILVLWAETPGLDEIPRSLRHWLALLKGQGEGDGAFLVRRIGALAMDSFALERFYEDYDPPLRLDPGPGTPSRTLAHWPGAPVSWQRSPLRRDRPRFWQDIERVPLRVRDLSEAEGKAMIDLARVSMVTRKRDLDAFCHADPRDVRLVDAGEGLQFGVIGVKPERRLLLESFYGFLTLRNGVPIGYLGMSALFGSSEIAYNIFETWRGAEAAQLYGRVLAMACRLFRVDTFCIFDYQLGFQNEEGIRSGAWWFYQKLGFLARDGAALKIMEQELAAQRGNQAHRTSRATLRRLAEHNVFLHKDRPREDVIGVLPLARVGERVARMVAGRFGCDRERAAGVLAEEAAHRLGVSSWKSFPREERQAFERWAPMLALLPSIERWTPASKKSLVRVARAKGGRRESDYVRLFDAHRPLRKALVRLVSEDPDTSERSS